MKVVACMMVKNEEPNMQRVLESLNAIADEVVVVDTGSTDKTVEIAELYGAYVYHHPWQNNFSLHRNQSIQYAEERGADWVIIIDADEQLVKSPQYTQEGFKQWIKEEIEDQGYTSIAFFVHDYQDGNLAMSCNSARMFKAGTIKYENIVHNQPVFQGACVLNHWFTLSHFGYDLSPEKMKKKFYRTKGLLYKHMKEKPDDPDTYFYLCQLYGHHGYIEKSRYWGEKYLSLKPTIPPERWNATIYFTLIRNYQDSKMLDEAVALMKEAMADKPHDPDLASAMSDHGALTRDNYLMAEGARRYITGFQECMNNPAVKGGQFYFSLTDDVLSLNLYRLCIASLDEGMKCWNEVKQRISTMHPTLVDELKTNLQLVGLPHLLQDAPALGSSAGRVLFDIREVEI